MWLVVVAVLSGVAAFGWPTRYRYEQLQMLGETAPGPVYPVRIDRFTGEAEVLMPEMLVDARNHMRLAWVGGRGEPLPADQVAKLKASTLIDVDPLPFAQFLNTTEWRITRVRWAVRSPAGSPPNVDQAPRFLDQSIFVEPNGLASLYLDLGRFARDATISLEGVWGQRP